MLKCPFCENELHTGVSNGWLCQCGEFIPFGYEIDTYGSCETCPIKNTCPKRK